MAAAPEPYESYIQAAAVKYGVPAALLRELVRAESGFNPSASSPAGAEGIAQFMPATAQSLGVNPWDPVSSINGAAGLLASYLTRYGGDVGKALAAYNAGPGAVDKYGGIPPFAETQSYVSRIEAAAGVSGSVTPGAQDAGFSLGDLNPLNIADAVAKKLLDLVWSAGRPVLITGALVAAGGLVVGLGLWRAVAQQRGG
jgi:hypothetical protein